MKKNIKTKIITLLSVLSIGAFSIAVTFGNNSIETKAESGESTVVRTDFDMEDGATIRKANPTGIRFSASLSTSKYADIITNGAFNENVQVGMIIVPESYFVDYNAQNEVTDYYKYFRDVKGKMINLPFSETQIALNAETGRYNYNGAIVGIKEDNLELSYQAVGYINTNGLYEYTELSPARSVKQVAAMAIVDNEEDRLTVTEAEEIGELYGIEYHQLNMPETFTVTDSQGVELLSDSRLLEDEELTIEFDYGYDKKAVIAANGETIATVVGAGKLCYPVTADVEFTVETTDVAYNYNANGTTGTLTVGTDGFISLPGKAKWGTVYAETPEVGGSASQRVISFEMKVSDLVAYVASTTDNYTKFNEMGFMFGANTWKPSIGTVAVDGDYYKLTFNAAASSLTGRVSKTAETFMVTFISPSGSTDVDVYVDSVKIGSTTRSGDARFGMWFDTRNTEYNYNYRYSYCVSDYSVFDEAEPETYTVTAASGMTVTKEDGTAVTSETELAYGENVLISFDYGYNKQAVVKANGETIATAVGAGTLKYPVTEDVTFAVETTDVTSYSYDGLDRNNNDAAINGTLEIKEDGFISIPQKIKWGKLRVVDKDLGGSVSTRVASIEMKVSDLADYANANKKITQFGMLFGADAAKIGFTASSNDLRVELVEDYYVITLWHTGCSSASATLKVHKDAETFKWSFVSTSTSTEAQARTITMYLDGVQVGSAKTDATADAALGLWFYTGASELDCRYTYCLSDYAVV